MAKCVKDNRGKVHRVSDTEAAKMIAAGGAKYISKDEWRRLK